MTKNKTTENNNSVTAYINAIADEKKRKDCADLIERFSEQTGFPPKMWGTSIVGFGNYHYKYESGREGDAPLAGLAARANAIVLYLHCGADGNEAQWKQLGKHKRGKGCVYVKQLADIDINVLKKIIDESVTYISHKHPS